MSLPAADPVGVVSNLAFIQPLVREYLGNHNSVVVHVSVEPLGGGTSGHALSQVSVTLANRSRPVILVLKQSAVTPPVEVHFYRSLAMQVPVATPRALWTSLPAERDGIAWVLMEKVPADGDAPWAVPAYRAAVEDMARLHAFYWGRTEELAMPWLRRPDEPALTTAAAVSSAVDLVRNSWLPRALPTVLTHQWFAAIEQTLPLWGTLIDDVLSLGSTLVHGDLWWRNILLLPDGQPTFIDWGSCGVFAGIWDFTYFIEMLRAVWHGQYRALPVPEARLVSWYEKALHVYGLAPTHADFTRAYHAARVLVPMEQWLGQLADLALEDASTIHPATRRHRAQVFARWQRHAHDLGLLTP